MKKDTTYIHPKKDTACRMPLKANRGFKFTCLLLFFFLTAALSVSCRQYVNRVPDPDKPLVFPEDHGAHDNAQWEWWYYNGHIKTESGNTYDYFFSFFKVYVDGDHILCVPMQLVTLPFFMYMPFLFGGFSILDHDEDKYETRYQSIMPFFWMGDYKKGDMDVWLGVNRAWRQPDNTFRVESSIGDYRLYLTLTPEGPPLLYGNDHNGTLLPPDTVHRYYSYTRMKTEGIITKGDRVEKVTGSSWMDHQFGLIYHQDFKSWDWIGMTLDNGTDVVFGLVHYFSNDVVPQSFCTVRFPDGRIRHLEAKDFIMRPVRKWRSSWDVVYVIDWEMEVPSLNLKLRSKAIKDNQVIFVPPMLFWEGPCGVKGTFQGKPVQGKAFLETWGDYDVPFRSFYRSEMKPRK